MILAVSPYTDPHLRVVEKNKILPFFSGIMLTNNLLSRYIQLLKRKAENMLCRFCLGRVSLLKCYKKVKCTRRICRRILPLSTSPIIYNSKTPTEISLAIMNYIIFGCSTEAIINFTGVTAKTVRKIREQMTLEFEYDFNRKNFMIGGKDVIVEIDESKFGKRKYHRGHHIEGAWVLGLVERTPERRIILLEVEKRDEKTLSHLINRYVHPDSIIYTDGWKGYNGLRRMDFAHLSVNHRRYFVDPTTGVHTNTIEGNWSSIKAKTPKRYRTEQNMVSHFIFIYICIRGIPPRICLKV
jgi:transposase-like protein